MAICLLFHKGRPIQGIYLLRFHHDPPTIESQRSTEWSEETSTAAIPTLQLGKIGVRTIKFTTTFNDFAIGTKPPQIDGYRSTKQSLLWLAQRQQPNPPLWDTPPTLVFTGATPETGTKPFFEGVITDVTMTSKVIAGPEVLARPGLLTFATKAGDVVRAEVQITLKEKYDPGDLGQPRSLADAFVFGVREGARREGQ